MTTHLTPRRKPAPLRRLYGKMSHFLGRLGSRAEISSNRPKATGLLESEPGARPSARGPGTLSDRPSVQVTTIGNKPIEPGLAAIWGWAFSGETDFPEGVVEVAFDHEDLWVTLSNRVPGGCAGPTIEPWSHKCGFQATLNTFLLSNGKHLLRLRVKTRSGQVVASEEVTFRVNNSGRLAETTTRLIKDCDRSKRIWADLIDSTDFPYDRSTEVAWFEHADAEERIAGILTKHNLPPTYESHLRKFIREGYVVLDDFIGAKTARGSIPIWKR